MRIGFDAKRYYHNKTGLGNYSRTVVGILQKLYPDNEYVLYDEKTLSRVFRMGRKAKDEGCDIFHGLSNELPFDSRHIPSVCTVHDVCWRTFPEMYHWADRQLYDLKYGSSCRRADKIIAISESTKRDIINEYHIPEERIEVIYQSVGENFYTPLLNTDMTERFPTLPKEIILYVGSINARKNLLGILKALLLIPKDQRPLLVVVGNGHEYRRQCESFISKNGLEQYVRIFANVNDAKDLQLLYSNARTFIYPSFYEGFGLPVVEAALQSTPVITSSVSSLPEAAGPDACYVDPYATDAPEQIAHHLDKLLSDEALHDELGKKMECYARNLFDPSVIGQRLIKLYEQL